MTNQMTIKEAADVCNKSIHTIKKLIQEKKIKAIKVKGKNGLEIRLEKNDILQYYNVNNDSDNSNNQDIRVETNEVLELRKDKEKLFAQIESRTVELERMQKLFENQQTLMLGLQQQIKSLTSNSAQNIPENSKSAQTTIEAKVSNPPKASKNTQNFDLFDESNQTPVEKENAPQKRRKWWFF